ncbi:50S ribosomal protein L22 [symbiont of Argiope bruennichi]|uniref:50S ribosomal protein L22 n=1 Tax=symbiont of Argiope bruennichi TaxID=2810479 RepID=UPI003DA4A896
MAHFNAYSIRISPRKLRLVSDLVRNLDVTEAINVLQFCQKRGAEILKKSLHSALNNAINNHGLNSELLYVDKILVNEAKTIKRFRPGPRGRTNKILKRSSHLKIELKERKTK